MPMPPPRWPLASVLAHRCGGALAPENTLAGLEVAARLGCRGVEFDVMLTGSGSPVLIHDETLDRTTSGRGRVADTSDATLAGLDAGAWFDARFAGQRVPSLQSAAARCIALDLAVNLEIKPSTGADEATGRIAASEAVRLWARASRPPLLSSFSERALEVAADVAPDLPRGLLVEAVPSDWQARCRRLGAVALHVEVRHLCRELVDDAHRADLWIVGYTVNDLGRAAALFDWGVDCIITDRPDRVRASP